jgi:hypothetical protein
MIPHPTYLSILDVAFGWHGIPVRDKTRSALPPVVRITLAMLLRAVVESRLGVYEPSMVSPPNGERPHGPRLHMEEVEGTPTALAEMHALGRHDPVTLATYHLSMDDLYVWATGEDLDPPRFCIPSWAFVVRYVSEVQPRKLRPELADKRLCQTIAKRRWAEDDQIRIAEMVRDHEIQIEGNGRQYSETTVRRWLLEVAPVTVRARPGRPVKRRPLDGLRNQAV